MTVFPRLTTKDNPHAREFYEPHALGWPEGSTIVFCGHFDGHDVYRRVGFDRFLVVYGNDASAMFEVSAEMAAHAAIDDWGTMRAVAKGRMNLVKQLDELVERLDGITRTHPDNSSFDVVVCDSCAEAADWIGILRKEVGL